MVSCYSSYYNRNASDAASCGEAIARRTQFYCARSVAGRARRDAPCWIPRKDQPDGYIILTQGVAALQEFAMRHRHPFMSTGEVGRYIGGALRCETRADGAHHPRRAFRRTKIIQLLEDSHRLHTCQGGIQLGATVSGTGRPGLSRFQSAILMIIRTTQIIEPPTSRNSPP